MSPTSTPGKGLWEPGSRMGTQKNWMPQSCSSMMSLAQTTAKFEKTPSSPGQNLAASIVGVCRMNSSVDLSKVAVVSIP
jgi:hypothetical protein